MELQAQFAPLEEVKADWLIVGVWEKEPLDEGVMQLDGCLGEVLARLCQKGDITGKTRELTPLLNPTGVAADRLLVVGLGKRNATERAALTDAVAAAARAITGKKIAVLAFALPGSIAGMDASAVTLACGLGLMQGCYGPGAKKKDPERFSPNQILLIASPSAPVEVIRVATRRSQVEGGAVQLARQLVNMPPGDLYPESFAQLASAEALRFGIECTILDERQLDEERMGALLAVARGSDRPPRLVVLRYRGGANRGTLGLVGKGVTFDSGGLSLKTTDQMVDMKCDMAGAATVLAAITAVAQLQIPVNLLGVLPLTENLLGGRAMKLGDILTTRNGKTIEVLNTDAEGRLILADALAYAVDQRVDHLVDLATLTGACMVALGVEVAGLMGNDESWCERVLAATRRVGERAWPLPMFPHYGELIKSHVADMRNTGGTRYGGAITAAKLLEQFVGQVPWAHLDIAGPAWAEHESPTRDPGGTGCFVRTLVELAQEYAAC